MSNPEDDWKDSAILIYVVMCIITLTTFVLGCGWALINNPNMRLYIQKLFCCINDPTNRYDQIQQDREEGVNLINVNNDKNIYSINDEEEKNKIVEKDVLEFGNQILDETSHYDLEPNENDEIEINLGLDDTEFSHKNVNINEAI